MNSRKRTTTGNKKSNKKVRLDKAKEQQTYYETRALEYKGLEIPLLTSLGDQKIDESKVNSFNSDINKIRYLDQSNFKRFPVPKPSEGIQIEKGYIPLSKYNNSLEIPKRKREATILKNKYGFIFAEVASDCNKYKVHYFSYIKNETEALLFQEQYDWYRVIKKEYPKSIYELTDFLIEYKNLYTLFMGTLPESAETLMIFLKNYHLFTLCNNKIPENIIELSQFTEIPSENDKIIKKYDLYVIFNSAKKNLALPTLEKLNEWKIPYNTFKNEKHSKVQVLIDEFHNHYKELRKSKKQPKKPKKAKSHAPDPLFSSLSFFPPPSSTSSSSFSTALSSTSQTDFTFFDLPDSPSLVAESDAKFLNLPLSLPNNPDDIYNLDVNLDGIKELDAMVFSPVPATTQITITTVDPPQKTDVIDLTQDEDLPRPKKRK